MIPNKITDIPINEIKIGKNTKAVLAPGEAGVKQKYVDPSFLVTFTPFIIIYAKATAYSYDWSG